LGVNGIAKKYVSHIVNFAILYLDIDLGDIKEIINETKNEGVIKCKNVIPFRYKL
jgi:hypothetical protein